MQDIKNTVCGLKGLVTLLQIQQRALADKGEPDPSEGSLATAKLALEQLKEKVEAILSPDESAGAEGFEVEVHEGEPQVEQSSESIP